MLNYVVIGTFVSTVAYVALNYHQVRATNGMMFPYVVVWCLCLAYFFGFYGISAIDKDTLVTSPPALGLNEVQKQPSDSTEKTASTKSATKSVTVNAKSATKTTPKPMNDAPICAEQPKKKAEQSETLPQDEPDYVNSTNEEVLSYLLNGVLKDHQLEKKLANTERAVAVRRMLYESVLNKKLDLVPYAGYDYDKVFGANCEICIGYVPIPLGIVGPLLLNGEEVYVPMATTEGCLVASTNRGCKAISASGGCNSFLLKDAITRAPCVRFPTAMRAAELKIWIEDPDNYIRIRDAFNSTTNYGRLDSVTATVAGRNVYLRFCCMSGDAMGMNMVSKGCLKAIEVLESEFEDMVLVAISGNMCTDKKPSAINWILGRGKSIVVESVISEKVVKSVLKTTVHDIIETNKQKNHIGSAMAGSIGGFNAHASNIVTAVYLATGQDPAQNVESSNCLTVMEYAEDGVSLHVSVTMPSVEVGTVGGGTHLPAQAGCLDICGVRGASKVNPGDNARKLAQIVGASVLAGELSLMAALAANHLVRSHMQHNRKPAATETPPVDAPALRKSSSMPEISHEAAAAATNSTSH
jgi:hydroxymethylglutaryl-CoA reductase (NADPH)